MAGRLIGWGYQGRTPEDLVHAMAAAGATRVVDVRLTPISRVRGFSKSRLRDTVEEAGLVYEHRPELGNPKDNRAGYAHPGTPAARAAHLRYYEEVTDTIPAQRAIGYLADLVDEGETVFVLCFEADESCCHRHQVIEAVSMCRDEAMGHVLALVG